MPGSHAGAFGAPALSRETIAFLQYTAYSVAPTGFDILKPSDFEAGIFSASPVLGLRPSRAGRSLT
jgi:hypothetical protein